ncbi:MAG TPA: GntR family transcriptional regulator [Firmicutes bacterium]|nr:GntR family transcriptional regulator [Bacillota bacterium]
MRMDLSDQALIYMQIAQMIEDDILRGVYGEDDQVPSTNELARAYNINPATAAKGINLLVADGILYKRRGIGMFVSKGAVEAVREKRKNVFIEKFISPLLREGAALGLSAEDIIAMIRAKGERKDG